MEYILISPIGVVVPQTRYQTHKPPNPIKDILGKRARQWECRGGKKEIRNAQKEHKNATDSRHPLKTRHPTHNRPDKLSTIDVTPPKII